MEKIKKFVALLLLTAVIASTMAGCMGFGGSSGGSSSGNYNFGSASNSGNDTVTTESTGESYNFDSESNSGNYYDSESSNVSISDSSYYQIFNSRYIVDVDTIVFPLQHAAFARVDDDGTIEKLEYGYEDDIIKEMIDTIYLPTEGLTDSEIQLIDEELKEQLRPLTEYSFCTVTYSNMNNFYCATVKFTDLDQQENVAVMEELGLVTGENGALISMSETRTSLLGEGYYEK